MRACRACVRACRAAVTPLAAPLKVEALRQRQLLSGMRRAQHLCDRASRQAARRCMHARSATQPSAPAAPAHSTTSRCRASSGAPGNLGSDAARLLHQLLRRHHAAHQARGQRLRRRQPAAGGGSGRQAALCQPAQTARLQLAVAPPCLPPRTSEQ